MTAFSALGLAPAGLQAATARGWVTPTPVQQAAIPAVLAGRDVWARAQTGSGKTAAFALPLIERCARTEPAAALTVLVLEPTRELAQQVGQAFETDAAFAPRRLRIVSAAGGVSINPQMMALRGGADVLVATPGRLLDLAEHHAVRLHALATLVLDEADRMLDLGFADELARILALLPEQRQNLLFSATFPDSVHALAAALLDDPLRIDIPSGTATTPRIVERAVRVDRARRTQLLRAFITNEAWSRVLVFTATRYTADHVSEKLRRLGIAAGALHGELSQAARNAALADFKAGRLQVLLATDLAARGIDITDLPAVVNYDLPRSPEDYLHRIGRTARAGAAGVAVSFVTEDNAAHFALIEKRHGRTLERETVRGFAAGETPQAPAPQHDGTGGIKGRRKSKKDKLREAAARVEAGSADTAARADFVWPTLPRKR